MIVSGKRNAIIIFLKRAQKKWSNRENFLSTSYYDDMHNCDPQCTLASLLELMELDGNGSGGITGLEMVWVLVTKHWHRKKLTEF